jgi:hypothetical protein
MAATLVADNPPASARVRCARTAAVSHCQPSGAAVSTPPRRRALSNSTVSYGLPWQCGSSTSASSVTASAGRCSVSPSKVRKSWPVRLLRLRCGTAASLHRDSMPASGCDGSTCPSRYAATSSNPSDPSLLSTMSTKPSGTPPPHCRSSMKTTSGRRRDATARSAPAATSCARTAAVSGSPRSPGPSSVANSGTTVASSPAFAPSARSIRTRIAATSSSGSASKSRPNEVKACCTALNS